MYPIAYMTHVLTDFSRNFGNTYQIGDDICGVYAEDRNDDLSRSDLLNGDVALRFIYPIESGTLKDIDRERMMGMHLGKTERVEIGVVRRIYEDTGPWKSRLRR